MDAVETALELVVQSVTQLVQVAVHNVRKLVAMTAELFAQINAVKLVIAPVEQFVRLLVQQNAKPLVNKLVQLVVMILVKQAAEFAVVVNVETVLVIAVLVVIMLAQVAVANVLD